MSVDTTHTLAPADEWISIADAADRWGLHRDTIRRRIADGTIRARRLGVKLIRVNAADVDAMMRPIPTAGRSV